MAKRGTTARRAQEAIRASESGNLENAFEHLEKAQSLVYKALKEVRGVGDLDGKTRRVIRAIENLQGEVQTAQHHSSPASTYR